MSMEAFGDEGPEAIDVDALYAHGWESDADCEVWWMTGEPETTYDIQDAYEKYRERIESED